MATSLATSLPMWLSGCTYDANSGTDLRNSGITAFFTGVNSGGNVQVLSGVTGGFGLRVSPGTGMQVAVQQGSFVVANSASPQSGGYAATLATSGLLTVAASDPTNPRIDIVVAFVNDVGGPTSQGFIEIVTGTPAASPVPPAAPANSITLAQVTVPATATSITSGNIADVRPFTAAAGGVVVAPRGTVTGWTGQLAYDKPSGAFYHNDNAGAGPKQARMLPWAPVHQPMSTSYRLPASLGTVTTANFTADGQTDIAIKLHLSPAVYGLGGSSADTLSFQVQLDSSTVIFATYSVAGAHFGLAGTHPLGSVIDITLYTSSLNSTTPAAGAHTVTLSAFTTGSAGVYGFLGQDYLRVEPVSL